jgi:hypothetical protein
MLAAMVLASSIAMLCHKNKTLLCNLNITIHSPISILAIGLAVGIVTGTVGASGEFLVVLALVVFL